MADGGGESIVLACLQLFCIAWVDLVQPLYAPQHLAAALEESSPSDSMSPRTSYSSTLTCEGAASQDEPETRLCSRERR